MTEAEAVKLLKELPSKSTHPDKKDDNFWYLEYDNEQLHVEADAILLNFLSKNGYTEIVKAWEYLRDEYTFWYV